MTHSPVAEQLNSLLEYFGSEKCSDIHLSARRGVWFVKDKATLAHPDYPVMPQEFINQIIEEFVPGGIAKFEEHQQGDASFDIGGNFRGRIAARKTLAGATITIRIITRDIPTVEQLNLPESLIDAANRPAGLFLFTGQTGSGKSTSIAALLNKINLEQPSAIYTLEAPIEFVYPDGKSLVNQREIGAHVDSFAVGVENAKRSHPKIILVGEILSPETARSAIVAAASGHMVVSTMHAGSTAETIDGLISMFPPSEQALIRTQLSQVLIGIVVQQLLPKVGGGMAMAQEIAFNTRAFSEIILGSDMKLAQAHLLGTGRQDRMVAMEASLAELVKAESITPELAMKMARDQRTMNDLLTQAGFTPAKG
ncbi:type IV pilus twitching motility protein PilT [Leifsonia sp. Leaf264]|uniref:type IV pilus twitching motility protein PilT n=1 Tax=Leifsonia sp. Leaf264 TaxID=1736314 RepID=UPI0006F822EC|nr:ATPase, T2SS/T4P/T4SS family [Leifsonia sp. Leaf264]KQO98702.1 hypothetical protein ASF30_11610 [Leifsonia sp. Leaf264]